MELTPILKFLPYESGYKIFNDTYDDKSFYILFPSRKKNSLIKNRNLYLTKNRFKQFP